MDNDLISRSALLEKAYLTEPATMNNPYGGDYVVKVEDIEAAPAIDAVEVVRCKDCKHEESCMKQLLLWERDHVLEQNVYQYYKLDFCSYGERRGDDATK